MNELLVVRCSAVISPIRSSRASIAETNQTEAKAPSQEPVKPSNPAAVKKAIALGKDIRKQADKTKADAAREMYALISGEPRDVIIQAFVDGAGLTPKGAQTYFYNCKRKAQKAE